MVYKNRIDERIVINKLFIFYSNVQSHTLYIYNIYISTWSSLQVKFSRRFSMYVDDIKSQNDFRVFITGLYLEIGSERRSFSRIFAQ